jgi:two-component system, OmpR family, phosphate regulon response regulator PhoB
MKRILIIEDQADIRRLIRWTLEFEDYEIHEAPNGPDGLEQAKSLQPDLVLLDVMMPGGLDGFQVCEQIKADARLARTPVVILTARSQERDRQAGERVGADAFLAKPFSPMQLVETVSNMLNQSAAAGSAA